MVNGTLISFEGPEGAGKSSVLEAVLPLLEEKGIPFITTREPGGVDIAEKIRQVILDPDHTSMDAKTELLLYIASRRQHLVERVLPALAAGRVVLMDRFIDSSVAYQGYGRGLSVEDIEWLNRSNCQKPRAGSQSFGFGRIGASPKSQTRLFGLVRKGTRAHCENRCQSIL